MEANNHDVAVFEALKVGQQRIDQMKWEIEWLARVLLGCRSFVACLGGKEFVSCFRVTENEEDGFWTLGNGPGNVFLTCDFRQAGVSQRACCYSTSSQPFVNSAPTLCNVEEVWSRLPSLLRGALALPGVKEELEPFFKAVEFS